MEIKFSYEGEFYGSISIIDETVNLLIDEDTEIYKKFNEEIENGLTDLKKFKNSGIPGRIKYKRKYEYKEDIFKLLEKYRQEFYIKNIVIVSKSDDMKYNILEICQLGANKISSPIYLLEFDNRYEYSMIKGYKDRYGKMEIESIEIDQVFIKLGTTKGRKEILAIDFMKEKFNIEEVDRWLGRNNIEILKDTEKFLNNNFLIKKALKFEETTIVLYESHGPRGNKWNRSRNRRNLRAIGELEMLEETDEDEDIEGSKTDMLISLNGIRIDFIPEIEIDLSKDLLFSNGHFIAASFFGAYGSDSIAFFKRKGDDPPLALILQEKEEIKIYICEKENQKIVSIEYPIDKIDTSRYFSKQ